MSILIGVRMSSFQNENQQLMEEEGLNIYDRTGILCFIFFYNYVE